MYKPQVPRDHYFKGYDDEARWISYWHQISEVLRTNPRRVLEVGIGNATVSDYLRKMGLDVTTADIDPDLEPDVVCSVTELSKCFRPDSFDLILCAEVLEHLPFEYFDLSLENLYTVTRKWVVLSLPYPGLGFSVIINIFPFLPGMWFKRASFSLKIPLFFREHRFSGQHYWEIGKKGYPLRKIRGIISKRFYIVREFSPAGNPYHHFFTLRKKEGIA